MKKMAIYEGAMCCDTGLCGPGVDKELLRITAVISALKKRNIEIGRFNLSSAPEAFVSDKKINSLLSEKGTDGLPALVVDGDLVLSGRYPDNKEIAGYLEIPLEYLSGGGEDSKQSSCCCEPGCCG
jgi:hypothetical protein